jgi:hypothetical protein
VKRYLLGRLPAYATIEPLKCLGHLGDKPIPVARRRLTKLQNTYLIRGFRGGCWANPTTGPTLVLEQKKAAPKGRPEKKVWRNEHLRLAAVAALRRHTGLSGRPLGKNRDPDN